MHVDKETISVALVAGVPGVVPTATVGGDLSMSWWSQHASGLFREASDKAGKYCYTPLCTLKVIKKPSRFRFRDSPEPEPEGDDLYAYVHII